MIPVITTRTKTVRDNKAWNKANAEHAPKSKCLRIKPNAAKKKKLATNKRKALLRGLAIRKGNYGHNAIA